MVDYCPSCGSKEVEKMSDKAIYCSKCDSTFVEEKGKKIKAQPTDRITRLENSVQVVKEAVTKIGEAIKPKQRDGEVQFPWGDSDG